MKGIDFTVVAQVEGLSVTAKFVTAIENIYGWKQCSTKDFKRKHSVQLHLIYYSLYDILNSCIFPYLGTISALECFYCTARTNKNNNFIHVEVRSGVTAYDNFKSIIAMTDDSRCLDKFETDKYENEKALKQTCSTGEKCGVCILTFWFTCTSNKGLVTFKNQSIIFTYDEYNYTSQQVIFNKNRSSAYTKRLGVKIEIFAFHKCRKCINWL